MGCTTSAPKDVAANDPVDSNAVVELAVPVAETELSDAGTEKENNEGTTVENANLEAVSEDVVSDPVSVHHTETVAAPVLSEPAVAKVPALKKGFILKEGHLVKNWKNRFFVLENGVLAYYESSTDKAPYGVNKKGEILLQGTIAKVDKNVITIAYDGDASTREGQTSLALEIRYPTERDEWFDAIRSHTEYANKTAKQ